MGASGCSVVATVSEVVVTARPHHTTLCWTGSLLLDAKRAMRLYRTWRRCGRRRGSSSGGREGTEGGGGNGNLYVSPRDAPKEIVDVVVTAGLAKAIESSAAAEATQNVAIHLATVGTPCRS